MRGNPKRSQSETLVGCQTEKPLLECIQLAVTVGNDDALALYKNMDFEVYGREPAALKVAGINYDESLLALALNQTPAT